MLDEQDTPQDPTGMMDAAAPEETGGATQGSSEESLEEVSFQKGKAPKEVKRPEDAPEEFTRAIYDVPVTVRVVLGQSRMSVEELVSLKRGEVLTLNKKAGDFADVFVNDRLIARGEIVLVDGSLGITLTELASERVS